MLIWILSGSLAAGHVTQTRTVLILNTRGAHRHRNRAHRRIWLEAYPLFYSLLVISNPIRTRNRWPATAVRPMV